MIVLLLYLRNGFLKEYHLLGSLNRLYTVCTFSHYIVTNFEGLPSNFVSGGIARKFVYPTALLIAAVAVHNLETQPKVHVHVPNFARILACLFRDSGMALGSGEKNPGTIWEEEIDGISPPEAFSGGAAGNWIESHARYF